MRQCAPDGLATAYGIAAAANFISRRRGCLVPPMRFNDRITLPPSVSASMLTAILRRRGIRLRRGRRMPRQAFTSRRMLAHYNFAWRGRATVDGPRECSQAYFIGTCRRAMEKFSAEMRRFSAATASEPRSGRHLLFHRHRFDCRSAHIASAALSSALLASRLTGHAHYL